MTYLERWIPTFAGGLVLMVIGLTLMFLNNREDQRRRSKSTPNTPHKEPGA